jgi:hypothetical protein
MSPNAAPNSDSPGIDCRVAAIAGCWSGLLVADVGRPVDCEGTTRVIGEFCDACDAGRLVLTQGELRCNVCARPVGRFAKFLDDGPLLRTAVSFLADALSVAEAYRRSEQYAGPRIPPGRPYWVLALNRAKLARRIAWEGQNCPRCPRGQLVYFIDPDGPEEGLVCANPACGVALGVCSSQMVIDGEALRKWAKVPLEDDPPAWLVRARRLSRRAGISSPSRGSDDRLEEKTATRPLSRQR